MRAFTYDVECVDLTADECTAYAQLVTETCHQPIQRNVSSLLANVCRPYPETTIDCVHRQARMLWRTEA